MWIVDLDTVTPTVGHSERSYLGITKNSTLLDEASRQCCLQIHQRPLTISAFCEEIVTLLSPDHVSVHTTPTATPRLIHTPLGYELDGEPLNLTPTEECILQALYEHRGETVSRAELCALLGNETNAKLADVYICLLRRKLEAGGTPRLLFTVRGIGYRLETEK